ncbi:MAG: hypothetical protein ACI837_000215 [Crocinitomicaceae bacterium]|jgi:hypothetical protein
MRKIYLALLALLVTPIVGAQVLFTENFDAGIGAWTVTDFLSDGNTWFGTTAGYGGGGTNFLDGTEFAMVDSDADGNGTEMIEDLTSGAFDATLFGPTVILTFDHYFRFLNTSDTGLVEVYDGAAWQTVATFVGASLGAWNAPDQQIIDVSAFANANMQIRFHYNDGNVWAWYWAVDNVVVSALVADDLGVAAVLNTSGFGLTAAENIDINVENFGGSPAINIPVYYSINGGAAVGPELVAGPIAPGGNANYTFAATADFSIPGPYSIVAWTEYVGDGDALNDTSSVDIINAVNSVVSLPLCLDFDAAADVTISNGLANNLIVGGLAEVIFDAGPGGGRLRTNAGVGYAQSGTRALTLDMDPSAAVTTNYVRIHLNMSNYDATTDVILMDYSIMEHGDELHPEDSVWLRGSDVDPWIGVADWNALTGGTNGVYFTDSDIDVSALLNANAQNFSATFEIRFGQSDNFPSTSTTASDGMTIDDVCLRQLTNVNASPLAVISPSNNACGNELMVVCATFENLGVDTLFTMPVTLNWTDGVSSGSEIVTYTDTLLWNEIDTVCFTPINSTAGGTFTFEVVTGLVGDEDMFDDTLSIDIDIVNITLDIDTAYCIASGDSLALASNVVVPGAVYNWYDSLVGGSLIYTGDTLFTGPLMGDTSYFVQSGSSYTFNIGAPDILIGASGTYSNYPDGLLFDVAEAIVIDSLTIYPEGAGDVVIRLLDNLGTPISSVTVTIAAPAVAFDPVRIGVNLPVGIGTGWQLDAVGTTVTQMMRNSGGGIYPYSEAGVMDITGAINGLAGYYYFWYDWQVSVGGCPSNRYEVEVGVNPTVTPADPGADLCVDDSPVTLLPGTPPAGTFSGTGVTGSTFDPAVAGLGTHTITYTFTSPAGCTGFADTTISVNALPVVTAADPGADDSLCVFEGAITLGEGTPAGGTFSGTGVTGTQFDPATAGAGTHTITYTYTSPEGCVGSADTTIVVDLCAAIDELSLAVKLFPNPATDILNIELEGNFTFVIVDTKGAVITSGSGINNAVVNTNKFQAGVYFVNISTGQGAATSKLIVQ